MTVHTAQMTKEEKAAYDRGYRAKKAASIAEYKAAWYARNAGRLTSTAKELYRTSAEHRAKKLSQSTAWRRRNPKAASAIAARSYVKNIEQKRAYGKMHRAKWPWKKAAAVMKRIATKKNATPPWVRTDQTEPFYRRAAELTAATGIKHEVDHIWPLQGVNFVGLHVPWNLQVIPKVENIKKGNKRPDAYR
jgi:hypothetical protein